MDVIDANWLRARLTGTHGEQKLIADAIGISADKVSKILAGERQIKVTEAARLRAYFSGSGFAEQAQAFEYERLKDMAIGGIWPGIIAALAPKAAHPALFQILQANPAALVTTGDVLIVDLGARPDSGALVVATVGDPETGEYISVLRRYAAPWLMRIGGDLFVRPEINETDAAAALATVLAVVRASTDPIQ